MIDQDRTVHAITSTGRQVARYDRTGKWYVEGDSGTRVQIRVNDAVLLACEEGALWLGGRPGGGTFDARVRRAKSAELPT